MAHATKGCCFSRAYTKHESFIYLRNSAFHRNVALFLTAVPSCKARCKQVFFMSMGGKCTGVVLAALSFLCTICTSDLHAQAFQDLNFESATLISIPGDPYNRVCFSEALPGWSGFSGTNQLGGALYDESFLDATGISIFDTNTSSFILFSTQPIDGNYSVILEAGAQLGGAPVGANVSLSQTGLVPPGTKSLSFLAETYGPFEVSLGGVTLNLISSPVPGQSYSLFEADISAFADQTDELDFTVIAQNPYESDLRGMLLDDIQFSPQAIPEPGALSLVMMAAAGLGLWRLAFRTRG